MHNIWHKDLIVVFIPTFCGVSNCIEYIQFYRSIIKSHLKHNFNMDTNKILFKLLCIYLFSVIFLFEVLSHSDA